MEDTLNTRLQRVVENLRQALGLSDAILDNLVGSVSSREKSESTEGAASQTLAATAVGLSESLEASLTMICDQIGPRTPAPVPPPRLR